MDRSDAAPLSDLPEITYLGLLLLFGVSTAGLIVALGASIANRVDLLLFCAGLGAMLTSLVWLALLALQCSRAWALALWLGIWVPYVNLVLAAAFARRYWDRGARPAALVALAGLLMETLASVRALLAGSPVPI